MTCISRRAKCSCLWAGDRVAVRASETPRGREGHVVEILARGKTKLAGQFRRERGIDFVRDSADSRVEVLIPRGESHGAKPGDIVSVEVLEHPTKNSHAIGRVIEVVGGADDAGIETEVAMSGPRHSARVAGGSAGRSAQLARRSAGEGEGRARGPAGRAAGDDRRRRCARLRRRGVLRTARRRLAPDRRDRGRQLLRARRLAARSRGARARHVRVFPGSRRADASGGAVERAVLAEPATSTGSATYATCRCRRRAWSRGRDSTRP